MQGLPEGWSILEPAPEQDYTDRFVSYLKDVEGTELSPYVDDAGYKTIGTGHRILEGEQFSQLSEEEADQLLTQDIDKHVERAKSYVGEKDWGTLSTDQKEMLLDYEFNVGLSKFPKFADAVVKEDWDTAAEEYERFVTVDGEKKSLGRNEKFFNTYLKPRLEGSQSPSKETSTQSSDLPEGWSVVPPEESSELPTQVEDMDDYKKLMEQAEKEGIIDKQALLEENIQAVTPDWLEAAGEMVGISPAKTAAAFVGGIDSTTSVYRGAQQLIGKHLPAVAEAFGIDEEQMQQDRKYFNELYADPELGAAATVGAVVGAVAEPVGFLIPSAKAATFGKTVAKAAGYGAAYGGMMYVDEERGDSRVQNIALGAGLGGAVAGGIKGVQKAVQKRKAVEASKNLESFDRAYAQSILDGDDIKTTGTRLREAGMDKDWVKEQMLRSGKKPHLYGNDADGQLIAKQTLDYYDNLEKARDLKITAKLKSTLGEYKDKTLDGLDTILGITSTRVGNIDKRVQAKLLETERKILSETKRVSETIDPFTKMLKELKGAESDTLAVSLANGEFGAANKIIANKFGEKGIAAFKQTQQYLKETGDTLVSLKILDKDSRIENYFPRLVKDKKGLLKSYGKEEQGKITQALKTANYKMQESAKRNLSPVEEAMVINKTIRGFPKEEGKLGSTKQRTIDKIDMERLKYYNRPEDSLRIYANNTVNEIEKTKFFGKYATANNLGSVNLNETVGAYVNKGLKDLDAAQQTELTALLNARFGVGEQSPNGLINSTKNILYSALLANPMNAAIQLGDLGSAVYLNGFRNTIGAAARSLAPKNLKINVSDYGLDRHIVQELTDGSLSGKFLDKALRLGQFARVDRFGKNTIINSSLSKWTKMGSSEKGLQKFIKAQDGIFDEATVRQMAKDLKAGNITDDVKQLLFNDLSAIQPITKSEVPEMYNKLKNGRVLYMLKSFTLKQVDLVRNTAYKKIKQGDIKGGVADLARYTAVMGSFGAGAVAIQDLIKGKDIDASIGDNSLPVEIGLNALKMFGYNEYLSDKIGKGEIIGAMTDMVTPPYQAFDKVFKGDEQSMRYAPVVGPPIYYWFMDGAKKEQDKQNKRREQRKKHTNKPRYTPYERRQ